MDSSAPVLVVEDDDLVRSFLCKALAPTFGEVDACATGAETIAAVTARPYAAILLDGLLPDVHGVELARTLVGMEQAQRSGICIVSGSLRRTMPLRHGISALPKPLRIHDLTAAVRELMDWHGTGSSTPAQRHTALDGVSQDLLVG